MLNSYEAIYDHGQIKWVDEPPPLATARVIVTLLPAAANEPERPAARRPSTLIAGKGKILGDILSPVVPEEDWDALR